SRWWPAVLSFRNGFRGPDSRRERCKPTFGRIVKRAHLRLPPLAPWRRSWTAQSRESSIRAARRPALGSTVRRVGAAGLALGLCLGAVSTLPALAKDTSGDTPEPPGNAPAPVGGGLLGAVDGG